MSELLFMCLGAVRIRAPLQALIRYLPHSFSGGDSVLDSQLFLIYMLLICGASHDSARLARKTK